MMVPEHILDDIKSRLPLSNLVGREVELRRRGHSDYWGLSPFKSERTPSFHVRDDQQFYHCFSTGEHGNHFTWLMRRQNISFMEAVKQLADETGVKLPSVSKEDTQKEEQRASLYEVMEFACDYFQRQLAKTMMPSNKGGYQTADYQDAGDMIAHRQISDEARAYFRIGFAPEDGNILIKEAKNAGIGIDLLIEAGLCRESNRESRRDYANKDNDAYAFFRRRIMFPITDTKNRVIAFGGRYLGDASQARTGKYINSPETPLYDKSYVLYHQRGAMEAVRQGEALLVAEGYMDVIALWQAGIKGCIAPLGTAVTEAQINHMWRFHDTPLFCLDGDEAGMNAAMRAAMRALAILQPAKSLSFAFLPFGSDPDSIIQEEGAKAFQAHIAKPTSLEEMIFQNALGTSDITKPQNKALVEKRIQEMANQIEDKSMRRHFSYALKDLFWQKLRELNANKRNSFAQPYGNKQFQNRNGSYRGQTGASNGAYMASRLKAMAERTPRVNQEVILALMIQNPDCAMQFEDELIKTNFDNDLDKLRRDLQIEMTKLYDVNAGQSNQIITDHLKQRLIEKGHNALIHKLFSPQIQNLVPQLHLSADKKEAQSYLEFQFEERRLQRLSEEIQDYAIRRDNHKLDENGLEARQNHENHFNQDNIDSKNAPEDNEKTTGYLKEKEKRLFRLIDELRRFETALQQDVETKTNNNDER